MIRSSGSNHPSFGYGALVRERRGYRCRLRRWEVREIAGGALDLAERDRDCALDSGGLLDLLEEVLLLRAVRVAFFCRPFATLPFTLLRNARWLSRVSRPSAVRTIPLACTLCGSMR